MFTHNYNYAYKGVAMGETELVMNDETVTLNGETLNNTAIFYLMQNGLKQALADSWTSAGGDTEAAKGLYEKKLAKIIAGTVEPGGGGGGARIDEITKRARDLAESWARKRFGDSTMNTKLVKKPDGERVTAAEKYAVLDAILSQMPKLRDEAREAIEREAASVAAASTDDIDLSAFGIE